MNDIDKTTFQFVKESLDRINLNSRKDLLRGTVRSDYAHRRGITLLSALGGTQKGRHSCFFGKCDSE